MTPGDTLRASLAALCMTENHKGGRAAAARPASRALACPTAQGHQQPRFCRHGAARGAKAPRRGGRRRPESAGRAQERTRSRPRRTERQTVSPKGWDGREAGLRRWVEEGAKVLEAKGQGGRDEAPLAREVVAGQRVCAPQDQEESMLDQRGRPFRQPDRGRRCRSLPGTRCDFPGAKNCAPTCSAMVTVLRTCEINQAGLRWARVRDVRDWGCARDMSQGSDRTRSEVDFSHELWQEPVPERGFGAKEKSCSKPQGRTQAVQRCVGRLFLLPRVTPISTVLSGIFVKPTRV